MKYIICSIILVALSAQAHIEPGIYTGTTDTGEICTMKAGATTFLDGMHHPLTERFALEVDSIAFSAGHPSAVDMKNTKVTFNHDLVQAINATPEGARALVVTMVHTAQFEGPSEYTLIDDNWAKDTNTSKHCGQLKFNQATK